MTYSLQKYTYKLHKVGLTEYEVLNVTKSHYYKGTIKCTLCGNIEEVDIHSKIRYKQHCSCIKTHTCIYCGDMFAPKTRYASNRKSCYNCNPYQAKENPKEYKQVIRTLNWNKLVYDLKLNGCVVCGFNEYPSALDFHHLDPTQKEVTPSQILHHDYHKVLEEVKKCVLVCANCHRGIHSNNIILEEE